MLIFVVAAVVVRSRLVMTLSNPRTIAVAEEDIITRHVLRRCSLHADLHALIVFALTVLGLGVLALMFVVVKVLFL